MAQRAYRNRKENAIQSLEKKVTELTETKEEMSNAFMRLRDFAVSRGLLDSMPEFGRELRATTEKFSSLAKRSSEGSGRNDDAANKASSDPVHDAASRTARIEKTSDSSETKTAKKARNDTACVAPGVGDAPPATDYEVVTHPTAENASFPRVMAADESPQGCPVGVLSPWASSALEPPRTLGHMEITFGRRLQRSTLEQALLVVDSPHAHPDLFKQVFGFCSVFEPRDKIRQRISGQLRATVQETLHYWRFPFLHAGGAGTFLHGWQGADRTLGLGTGRSRVGNQGLPTPHRPPDEVGYSFGPFNADVMSARDKLLGTGHRINLPGWEGDFFDPDEVEAYLRQRGVSIPPQADYVTVEIDLNSFPDEKGAVPEWLNTSYFGKPISEALDSRAQENPPPPNTALAEATAPLTSVSMHMPVPPAVESFGTMSVTAGPSNTNISGKQPLVTPESPLAANDFGFGIASSAMPSTSAKPPPNLLDTGMLAGMAPPTDMQFSRRVVTVDVGILINGKLLPVKACKDSFTEKSGGH